MKSHQFLVEVDVVVSDEDSAVTAAEVQEATLKLSANKPRGPDSVIIVLSKVCETVFTE